MLFLETTNKSHNCYKPSAPLPSDFIFGCCSSRGQVWGINTHVHAEEVLSHGRGGGGGGTERTYMFLLPAKSLSKLRRSESQNMWRGTSQWTNTANLDGLNNIPALTKLKTKFSCGEASTEKVHKEFHKQKLKLARLSHTWLHLKVTFWVTVIDVGYYEIDGCLRSVSGQNVINQDMPSFFACQAAWTLQYLSCSFQRTDKSNRFETSRTWVKDFWVIYPFKWFFQWHLTKTITLQRSKGKKRESE